jgi:hypothetical protein
MARLLWFGDPKAAEEIDAVVIVAFEVTDEMGRVVCGAHTKAEAESKARQYAERYPTHRFYASKE